ncbi:hypothetical protein EM595_2691 [Duffyella gerundensis]|uniref:Uncharacterized protein n=1 Tax=Duffyella gerundensis TaxID=1619313 RepID=A0A0U5L2F0_9GAMM|nr:hypothetical protein EM595_2691 [Duffyella gerundensis]
MQQQQIQRPILFRRIKKDSLSCPLGKRSLID